MCFFLSQLYSVFLDFPKQERKPVQNLVPVNTPQAQQQNQIKINSLNVDTEKNNKIKVNLKGNTKHYEVIFLVIFHIYK